MEMNTELHPVSTRWCQNALVKSPVLSWKSSTSTAADVEFEMQSSTACLGLSPTCRMERPDAPPVAMRLSVKLLLPLLVFFYEMLVSLAVLFDCLFTLLFFMELYLLFLLHVYVVDVMFMCLNLWRLFWGF